MLRRMWTGGWEGGGSGKAPACAGVYARGEEGLRALRDLLQHTSSSVGVCMYARIQACARTSGQGMLLLLPDSLHAQTQRHPIHTTCAYDG